MVVVGNVELVILSVEEGVPFRDTGDIRYKGKEEQPQLAIILLQGPSLFGVGIEKPRWWAPFREQVRSMGQSSWLTTAIIPDAHASNADSKMFIERLQRRV
ncbi:hypothetical protein HZH66_008429 [Vespula vulgaris]|uniref:Uncharacterized protein n=1 Tax=Vespula vulgaris TaxID=7454 RepID=A0A834JW17_VESVU|nr:hypothetical protein HZH66_008429 [Vespula vulgaris]